MIGAGRSSPVARQAHNLKVVDSNPIPATVSPELSFAIGSEAPEVGAAIILAMSPTISISNRWSSGLSVVHCFSDLPDMLAVAAPAEAGTAALEVPGAAERDEVAR